MRFKIRFGRVNTVQQQVQFEPPGPTAGPLVPLTPPGTPIASQGNLLTPSASPISS